MTLPFGFPFTNVATAFDIFCFLASATDGEDCFGSLSVGEEESRDRSDEDGIGLRSDATGTMIACRMRWLENVRCWVTGNISVTVGTKLGERSRSQKTSRYLRNRNVRSLMVD